jgi:hypothetical protein
VFVALYDVPEIDEKELDSWDGVNLGFYSKLKVRVQTLEGDALAWGMGMTKDMPLEHWFRGLRVARVVEGPSEIHRFLIARDMLGGAALGRGA